jgi:hypothetical protein
MAKDTKMKFDRFELCFLSPRYFATGTGKLLLSEDRKSIRELTIKGRSFDVARSR